MSKTMAQKSISELYQDLKELEQELERRKEVLYNRGTVTTKDGEAGYDADSQKWQALNRASTSAWEAAYHLSNGYKVRKGKYKK